jgi:hypothetical protein
MGLLQRSFLDLAEDETKRLEVAFVIDYTDSMAKQIEGIRKSVGNMAADLKAYKGDEVKFSAVVYRDIAAKSGEVQVLSEAFIDDALIIELLEKAPVESGEPYFHELVDLGIHEAMTKLRWTEGDDVQRWLIVIGDAPPLDANFSEEKTGARRRYEDEILIQQALNRGIAINCILCESDFEAYAKVVDKAQRFMNRMSSATSGLMLDLSQPGIQAKLREAVAKPRVKKVHLGLIAKTEVEEIRSELAASTGDSPPNMVIAVLPPTDLPTMNFDPDNRHFQMSMELSRRLSEVPHLTIFEDRAAIRTALRRARDRDFTQAQFVQLLRAQMGVDYVIWGEMSPKDNVLGIDIHNATTGELLTQGPRVTGKNIHLASTGDRLDSLAGVALDKMFATVDDPNLVAAYKERTTDPALKGIVDSIQQPLSDNEDVCEALNAGFTNLASALEYPVGSEAGNALLSAAEKNLLNVTDNLDLRNTNAFYLLANCYYNQAQGAAANGEEEAYGAKMKLFKTTLGRAYGQIQGDPKSLLEWEIAADYQLHLGKPSEAIEIYEKLSSGSLAALNASRRAHWMLAGIYGGDWGVAEEFVNPTKARDHLIEILARWPESPEARFIAKSLRWDEQKGSRNPYFHLEGTQLTDTAK